MQQRHLQVSALWVKTPVYILAEPRDHAWMLVVTPDYIAWVESKGIARANDTFIDQWSAAAKNKMIAITRTETPITEETGEFQFLAYVGSVFPTIETAIRFHILIPTVNAEYQAIIKNAVISADDAVLMPYLATPHLFTNIMKTLIGRPYGWGGIC